jgi:hypothetical protein
MYGRYVGQSANKGHAWRRVQRIRVMGGVRCLDMDYRVWALSQCRLDLR